MMYQWIGAEPEQLPLFGQLLIYGALYLLVFLLTCLHSVCLLLTVTRLSAQGVVVVVGGLKSYARCEGGSPCLLCCLPSHFMAPSVHKQTVKW